MLEFSFKLSAWIHNSILSVSLQQDDDICRLAIYYRKNKDYDNEIKVLETAIDVFTHDVPKERMDRASKLEKFKARLKRAKELKAKAKK